MSVRIMKKGTPQEDGLVAIVVTMVLMMVISLIVVGFAKITQRDQRETLDRQLSTQAYYAAETGINDAKAKIDNGSLGGNLNACDNASLSTQFNAKAPGTNNVIDATANVSYSCVSVNHEPKSIDFDQPVTPGHSVIIPAKATGVVNSLKFSWQAPQDGGNPATHFQNCPDLAANNIQFPPAEAASGEWDSTNCQAGVLRIDIVPTDGGMTRDSLDNALLTVFLYPQKKGSGSATNTVPYNTNLSLANNGVVVGVECASANPARQGKYLCNGTVTGMSGHNNYGIRIRPVYESAMLSVSAFNGTTALGIGGSQVQVDVTGKAQDLLRHIQVRLPVPPFDQLSVPDFALQTTDGSCKLMTILPGGAVTANGGAICQSSLNNVPPPPSGGGGGGGSGGGPVAAKAGVMMGARAKSGSGALDIAGLENFFGRSFNIDHGFWDWGKDLGSLNVGMFADDAAHGRISMISWNGGKVDSNLNVSGGYDEIVVQNKWDDYIDKFARDVKALNRPVMLRFFWEMDLPFSGDANPPLLLNASDTTTKGQHYIALWNYVRDRFAKQGVTNVSWLWVPSAQGYKLGQASSYYPTGTYEPDWIGADGYINESSPDRATGSDSTKWRSFYQLFDPNGTSTNPDNSFYDFGTTKNKPMIIGETGITEGSPPASTNHAKAAWFGQAETDIKAKMPNLKAIVYFSVHRTDCNKQTGVCNVFAWEINSSNESFTAYKNWMNDPYYNP